jgi:hypothetical protein
VGLQEGEVIMTTPTARFYNRIRPHLAKEKDLPDFFVYHLTVQQEASTATTQDIRDCYRACDIAAPTWLGPHLSNGLKSRPKLFVRSGSGYRLEHKRREHISKLFGEDQPSVETSGALDRLESRVAAGPKRDFLHETIKCFSVGANRAAVVMCWNLALHHLQDYVVSDAIRLAAFNATLALNKDQRVKIKVVTKQDDFTEMPEGKFLLFCRESKLITGSLFKKLETRLDERNGAAHPSGLTVTPKAAEAYIEDLVENVVMKFET